MTTVALLRSATQRPRLIPALAASAWLSTVVLILIGSIVRVTGHGLGCPDWPLCYGQAIPPAYGGAWVEFSHRLFGGIAGVQILLLASLAWREGRGRPWSYRPAVAAAGLLAIQVLLGGLHVILELPPQTGLVHTGVAMLIVGLLAAQLAVSSPRLDRLRSGMPRAEAGRRLGAQLSLVAAATYGLLLTGSTVTRSGASLACLAFPECGSAASVSQPLIEIHMLHRIAALAVLILAGWLIGTILARSRSTAIRRFARTLAGLLVVQTGLGIANVLLLLPMWSRVLHLTLAAVFWSAVVLLWAATLSGPASPPSQVERAA
ncbi:MAG: COX15/CtaA family protein [Anaerolineales bacterium]